jgi:cell division transport system ATP-binding protein
LNLLNDINAEGITVIMATHDIEILKLFPKRVIEIQKGKIVKDTKRDSYEINV